MLRRKSWHPKWFRARKPGLGHIEAQVTWFQKIKTVQSYVTSQAMTQVKAKPTRPSSISCRHASFLLFWFSICMFWIPLRQNRGTPNKTRQTKHKLRSTQRWYVKAVFRALGANCRLWWSNLALRNVSRYMNIEVVRSSGKSTRHPPCPNRTLLYGGAFWSS